MNCENGLLVSENRWRNDKVGETLEVQIRKAFEVLGFLMKPHKVYEGGLDEDGKNSKGLRVVGNCNNFAPLSYLSPERFNSYLKDFDDSEDSLKLAIASYDVFTKEQTIELKKRGIHKIVIGKQILDYSKKSCLRVIHRMVRAMIELDVISEVHIRTILRFIERNFHRVCSLIMKSVSCILSNVMPKQEPSQETRPLKEPHHKCCTSLSPDEPKALQSYGSIEMTKMMSPNQPPW